MMSREHQTQMANAAQRLFDVLRSYSAKQLREVVATEDLADALVHVRQLMEKPHGD